MRLRTMDMTILYLRTHAVGGTDACLPHVASQLHKIVFANPQNANVHQRKRNAHESMHMHMAWAKLGTHSAA